MTTTDDYIATFPDEVRPILTEVAEALRRALPGAEERMRYGMPAFMLGDRYALHFAGWKKHVGLYPVPTGDAKFEEAISPYRRAKDTVRFPISRPVPLELVSEITELCLKRRAAVTEGHDA